jgi:O-antigen/teichoic acid export membrane protein
MRSASPVSALSFRRLRRHMTTGVMVHAGVAVAGVILARLLTSLTQIALARLMGVAAFGAYTSVYTLLGPVVMIASLGLDTWLLRQSGAGAAFERYISEVFSLRLLMVVALMLVGVPAVLVSGDPAITLPITVLAAFGLICELLLTTAYTVLRAQIRNYTAALLQVIVASLLILLLWLFWDARAPLLVATGYRLLAGLVGAALMAWLLRHNLRLVWQPRDLLQMVKQARVYFASDLLANVTAKCDLTLVALLMGAVATGIYSPALTIINTTFLIPTVLWQVFLPVLARQEPGSRGFHWTMSVHLAGNLLYGLFWSGVLFAWAAPIVQLLYGAQFGDAVPLLRIMSLIPLLKSINFCTAIYMVVRDRQGLRAVLLAIGAVVNAAGNLIAIPLFGLTGAAWVNLGTEAIVFLCYGYGCWVAMRGLR